MTNKRWLHEIFKIAVFLKGINGTLETIAGFLLFFVSSTTLLKFINFLFGSELMEDPHDFIVSYLLQLARGLSLNVQLFVALYLFVHGIINLGMVFALRKEKLWAYPLVEVILVSLVIYQLFRFSYTHSIFLLLLTLLDILIIGLTWGEYKRLKTRRVK